MIAIFVAAPYILYQLWCFVAPGLYKRERRLALPFLFFGSLFFLGGGAFGYYAAVPQAASEWLIDLGRSTAPASRCARPLPSRAASSWPWVRVFEMPILIFFLARIGVVTPQFLLRHFKLAVLILAVLAAVLTPTGDMVTMSFFVGPMVLLYLLGIGLAYLAVPRSKKGDES